MKFEAGPFLLIILISIVLCACFGLAIFSPLDLGIAIKPPDTDEQANLDAYNHEALQEDAIGIFEVDLTLAVLPPSSSQEERSLIIEPVQDIWVYVRDDSDTLDVEEFCIDYLDLIAQGDTDADGFFTYEYHSFLPESLCHTMDPDKDFLRESGSFISGIVDGETQTFEINNYYVVSLPRDKTNPYVGAFPRVTCSPIASTLAR